MFQWLSEFDRILVSGPQRSGTRICAQMIAHDTGYRYVDESEIGTDSLYLLWWLFHNRRRFVVHCPALCRHVHMFSANGSAVVLVRRSIDDILASQQRIGWGWEGLELVRYDQSDGVSSQVKYDYWDRYQKERIEHAFEIEYHSLVSHPLWCSDGVRRNFGPTQTTLRNDDLGTDSDAYPCSHPDILYWEPSEHEHATLVMGGPAKALNETGRLIWTMCDGQHTRQDILESLKAHFVGMEEDVLLRDLDAFINDLVDGGFLYLSSSAHDG
jgi:hypothetical protein